MRKKITYKVNGKDCERNINYIPARYIFAILLSILETLFVFGIIIVLSIYIPYFYILSFITQIGCVIHIVARGDNPDYKIPWLLFVILAPVVGYMMYFMFYSRKLKKKYISRRNQLEEITYINDDEQIFQKLKQENVYAYQQAVMLCKIAKTHIFEGNKETYFSSGEAMWKQMLIDLNQAQEFIFLEYFIIEEGVFWNSILDILKQKVLCGVKVKVLFDDIGCMMTLPGNYAKTLQSYGIEACVYARLRGAANSEFNNRNHRKLMIIDGLYGYTGGVNLCDEYINGIKRFGHWKDIGVRLQGRSVYELTRSFLIDFGMSYKKKSVDDKDYFPLVKDVGSSGYIIPFGDGPKPLYSHRVSKTLIESLLSTATKYVYITTPYLIIDNELFVAIENAVLRGIDARIIVPHIPDKKLVFKMTQDNYQRLILSKVKVYEYEPGFIHAKSYIVDDLYAIVGTINLDYRSLVHHFENGVWMYQTSIILDMKNDFLETMDKSIEMESKKKRSIWNRMLCSLLKIFAPLL